MWFKASVDLIIKFFVIIKISRHFLLKEINARNTTTPHHQRKKKITNCIFIFDEIFFSIHIYQWQIQNKMFTPDVSCYKYLIVIKKLKIDQSTCLFNEIGHKKKDILWRDNYIYSVRIYRLLHGLTHLT